jgi:hypothetical protein
MAKIEKLLMLGIFHWGNLLANLFFNTVLKRKKVYERKLFFWFFLV